MPENGSQAGGEKGGSVARERIEPPSISLPKGGGAIRGIGEKFAANPVTGTGSMTVPIATSPGRSGFGPQLSLSYDSGAGNGPFGFGWSLSLPSITRKTDKGLPKYQDADESDVFILSGAEDLVPVLVQDDGQWRRETNERTVGGESYSIQRYRPRIEGLFARIERWTNLADPGDTFWRSISRDNVTTWYGKTGESRIAGPADPTRIFSWLICESYDDTGNVIVYGYQSENSDAIDLSQAHEGNRTNQTRAANRHLKRIKYGNRTPYYPILEENQPPPPLPPRWLFEVVLDYGEHDPDVPMPEEPGKTWPCRNDPFSSYRAGFEVRTYRLCQRVLMFHHFPDEQDVGADCLVRSTDFTYSYEQDPASAQNPIFSFLLSVSQSGYKRQHDGYLKKSLPPLEFEYSRPTIDEAVREVDPESLENLPYGLDGAHYQWVDLDGEGLSGILTEQADGWFYKPNLSPVNVQHEDGKETITARFGPVELVAQKPSLAAISGGRQQLLDLAGDGQLDLVELRGPTPGFYERTQDGGWETFAPFESLPVLDWDNPNLKFVDLTGDGHADIFITEDEVFCWHPSLAEAGFAPPERVRQALDEEKGPKLVFADGTQSIHLADMSGDGLTDLVRIRNGEVCYWPNLGYGRFGTRVAMDNAPWFETPDQFDQRRVHIADIDGSGITDIVYLAGDGVRLYFNQSGNAWSEPRRLNAFPQIDNLAAVTTADLLGNDTACLVWSSPLPGHARRPMRYIDLMGGQKPHLLVKTVNNLGAETVVHYAPSTKCYLADKLAERPWITRLPFPVHVVERVETYDRISRNRFVTRYAYHHGYFDGSEREFRGFGMVEQFDTEEFAALSASDAFPIGDNIDVASHVPPVHTKTWFHTGVYLGREQVSDFFAGLLSPVNVGEYYREPGATNEAGALLLADTILPMGLDCEEEREACRALKGAMLRQEVYALDGGPKEAFPYSVVEQSFTIRVVQRRGSGRHAVFFTHPREAFSRHYERIPNDPRVSHTLTMEVNDFGNVLKSASICYGRRRADTNLAPADQEKQGRTHVTYLENTFTNAIDASTAYRAPAPSDTRLYELTGLIPTGDHLTLEEVLAAAGAATVLGYEAETTEGTLEKRLIEHACTLYRRDDLSGPEAWGTQGTLGLSYESYKLALTPGQIAKVYVDRVSDGMLDGDEHDGGYIHLGGDANWWIPSGLVFLSPNTADTPAQELTFARSHFFLPQRFRDPFGVESVVTYDAYALLVIETRDALDNRVTVGQRAWTLPDGDTLPARRGQDYRVLQPALIMDPNGNRAAVAFDALGLVVGTAVMGKPQRLEDAPDEGDRLTGNFRADLALDDIEDLVGAADPISLARTLLGEATTRIVYDLTAYQRDPAARRPSLAATIARETHVSDLAHGQEGKVQVAFAYSDGFGREIQKKIQAEPGPGPVRDGDGRIVLGTDGRPQTTPFDVELRWVGSGWTVFNNKGAPVRQFEPFFTDTHAFERDVRIGVSPVLFYDPAARVVATLHPNHTWEKVIFDPWRQEIWDVNDTALIADPRTDSDVGDFLRRLPDSEHQPSWHALRTDPAHAQVFEARFHELKAREAEIDAARKTEMHAATPTIMHADSLGRPFLTIAYNRFEREGAVREEKYESRVTLDIEGNEREVIDALGRVVMRYAYDLLGSCIHQASMEAGARWMLGDVAGQPIHGWDSRGHHFQTTYDLLRRPLDSVLAEGGAKWVIGRTVYGENQLGPEARNLRGKVFEAFDQAGVTTSERYDFKGNLLASRRRFATEYRSVLDWDADPDTESDSFTTHVVYDALNRAIEATAPDGSVYLPSYNEANFLETVDVRLQGATDATRFVDDIDYDVKGERTLIVYHNGARTIFDHDPETLRLTQLTTTRGPDVLQDLTYAYDPAGNITSIEDAAQQIIYFDNQVVTPSTDYVYDAVYRLIRAEGREHKGLAGRPQTTWSDASRVGLAHPHDWQAMRRYTEHYHYDAVGNFEKLRHAGQGDWAAQGSWTRNYTYDEPSLLEPAKRSNRLSTTRIGEGALETYRYDAHGNMADMPHLLRIDWDFRDQIREIDLGGGGVTYYVYDGNGQRARKVVERIGGAVEERLYVGGFEVHRKRNGTGALELERQTLHVMDDAQRIALVETRTVGQDASPQQLIRYQLGNHLGSATLELDRAGIVISYEEYYPYGATSYQAHVTETPKRYRYTGMERDEDTGLSYHGARYYAPWLGRWVSCDPLGLVDGSNLFRFVRNSPIVLLDNTGNEPKKPRKKKEKAAVIDDVVQYDVTLKDKKQAGKNVQKDHVIGQAKIKLMTTDPSGKTNYDPNKDPAVVVDTGKATATSEAKPHTKKTFHDAQSDVNEIKRLRSEGINSITGDIVEPSRNAAIRSGMKPESVDKGIWGQLDNLHSKQTLAESGATLKRFGKSLAKLGPLGTVVGVATAVTLLARGEVWGAVRELVGALPIVGDLLDIFDLGSAAIGWLFGGGSSKKKITADNVDEYLTHDLSGLEIVALTWDPEAKETGGKEEEGGAPDSSSKQLDRMLDLGGMTLRLQLVPRGSAQGGLRLPLGQPPAGPLWEWDEYLLLDLAISHRLNLRVGPTDLGPALQGRF